MSNNNNFSNRQDQEGGTRRLMTARVGPNSERERSLRTAGNGGGFAQRPMDERPLRSARNEDDRPQRVQRDSSRTKSERNNQRRGRAERSADPPKRSSPAREQQSSRMDRKPRREPRARTERRPEKQEGKDDANEKKKIPNNIVFVHEDDNLNSIMRSAKNRTHYNDFETVELHSFDG